jgi:hypothetical protein
LACQEKNRYILWFDFKQNREKEIKFFHTISTAFSQEFHSRPTGRAFNFAESTA